MISLAQITYPELSFIGMAGLSGGEWATHIVAAIDDRITLSFTVAGAYPLYLRPHYRGSMGDAEQIDPGLYEERATWLDIYILGAYGNERKQIQILNKFDPCCFPGNGGKHYETAVSKTVTTLSQGKWQLEIDKTHRRHKISAITIELIMGELARF